MNKGKRIAALVSIILLFCALIFVVYELFQVRVIKVSGSDTLDEGQVEALSGIEYGTCIFFVDTDAAMEALAAEPAIKPVGVKVVYPYTVEIEIAERKPAGYIDTDGMRLTIDNEGVLLSVDMSPQGEALPQVSGLSLARFEVGQPLGEDAYKRGVFTSLLGALKDSGLSVDRIDLTYTAAIKIGIREGYTIELGDENDLPAKLALAGHAMDELTQLGKTGGVIDVATGIDAYYREN